MQLLCLTIPNDAHVNQYLFLNGIYRQVVYDMEVLYIEPSSLSAIVHGVVVGKVSPALLTSWCADVSCVLFQP